jgi:hypothetical protein
MSAMCANCPFAERGPGRELRRTLAPGRWRGIVRDMLRGGVFYCHKTTTHDDDGEFVPTAAAKLCAGALEFQEAHGVSSNYQRVCERLDALHSAQGGTDEGRD